MKGAGDIRFVMFMAVIISTLVLIIPTYTVILILECGMITSWVFASLYAITLGIVFYIRFLGGNWKDMRVIERSVELI